MLDGLEDALLVLVEVLELGADLLDDFLGLHMEGIHGVYLLLSDVLAEFLLHDLDHFLVRDIGQLREGQTKLKGENLERNVGE